MLQVKGLHFSYQEKPLLQDIHFELSPGKALAIMGESGSGKSTLLRLLYGLLDSDKGQIFWGDKEILGPKYHLVPGMPFMKYLAQDFDLMPFTTVYENVGQFLSNIYLDRKKAKVTELLELVGMTAFAHVKTKWLSGGQLQRVALARVLALAPEILLLDEPFSHIDTHQKNELSRFLFSYCQQNTIAVVYVTHTPEEALQFADELLVLKNGKIVTQGSPNAVYQHPKNAYVAQLTGTTNVLPSDWFFSLGSEKVMVRPHELVLEASGKTCQVVAQYFHGAYYLVQVQHDSEIFYFHSPKKITAQEVQLVWACRWAPLF